MAVWKTIFWVSFGLVLYPYFLYPLALWMVSALVRRSSLRQAKGTGWGIAQCDWPTVSLLVAAFNEEKHLAAKLANCDQIDYLVGRLEVIFVSDGSTDGTDAMLARVRQTGFCYERLPQRQGKPAALNQAAEVARGEIFIFSDAATLFGPSAVKQLVHHFQDPEVGVVCGEPDFHRSAESAATEGLYWNYERALRRLEGQIGATLGASGTIYAVRRACFRPLAPNAILDDFLVPMAARRLGYRVVYDPEAQAWDYAPAGVREEFIRRARLAGGSFSSLSELSRAALTSPALCWTFVSHKLLRWLVPVWLLLLVASSLALVSEPLYRWALVLQAAVYLWAAAGLMFRERLKKVRFGLVGYFLVAMNLAFLVGMARWATGRQSVMWRRV